MSCGCDNQNLTSGCGGNPCAASAANTATCESLPSIIQNFISHFFGDVIKSEVGGAVSWALPCNLDIGLENNPRISGEGLACYFLRLFQDGIVGATGPQGDTGAAGTNGNNAYSVTLQGFTQPTSGSWAVKMVENPAIRVGETVFVEGSGYSEVTAIGVDWTVFLTMVKPMAGVTGTVTAGKVVVVSGPQGITGAKGDKGDKGNTGDAGPVGPNTTTTNGSVVGAGSSFDLDVTYGQVAFGGVEPQVTLPTAGTYLITAIVGIDMAADAAASPPEQTHAILWDATSASFIAASEQLIRNCGPSEQGQIVIQTIYVTGSNTHTVQLFAKTTTATKASVVPVRTSLTYVRLQ